MSAHEPDEHGQPATSTNTPYPAEPRRLKAAAHGYTLDLAIAPTSPIMLNGNAGLNPKADSVGRGEESYYYFDPAHGCARASSSAMAGERRGQGHDAKTDREWGSSSLGGDQQGVELVRAPARRRRRLVFFALHKRDGARDAPGAGTWLAPDGTV